MAGVTEDGCIGVVGGGRRTVAVGAGEVCQSCRVGFKVSRAARARTLRAIFTLFVPRDNH